MGVRVPNGMGTVDHPGIAVTMTVSRGLNGAEPSIARWITAQ